MSKGLSKKQRRKLEALAQFSPELAQALREGRMTRKGTATPAPKARP